MWKTVRIATLMITATVLCLGLTSQPGGADILEEVFNEMPYVDLEKVFQEYQKKKDLEAKLQAEGESKQQQLAEKREELEKLREEYEAQKFLLTEEAKKQRQEEIAKKSEQLKNFLDKISQQMKEKENQYTEEILSDIMRKIEQIAEREGYVYVFDKQSLLYAAPTQDITQLVIDELNKEYGAKE